MARATLAAAYPAAAQRVITVMNGIDDDPLPPPSFGHRFTIAYAGTIYLERHLRNLLRAAARVVQELRLTPVDFGVDLMGGDMTGQHSILAAAREEGVADFVSTRPAASHESALEFLARATMLVTFPGWDVNTIPAKIFECVRFDAWLLPLCDPDSAAEQLLREIGVDVFHPEDIGSIAAIVRRRYSEYRRGMRPIRAVADERYSRRTQAGILLDAIARLRSSGPRHSGRACQNRQPRPGVIEGRAPSG
jgi:hypothetical protein